MSECGRPDCYVTDLHTHQVGTGGVIEQVCKHGSLARQCRICELESELKAVRKAWEEQDDRHLKYEDELIARTRRLKEHNEEMRQAIQDVNDKLTERDRYKAALEEIAYGSSFFVNSVGISLQTNSDTRYIAKAALEEEKQK